MKLGFSILLAFAVAVGGAVVNLAWEPSPSVGVAAYRIWGGTNGSTFWVLTNCGPVTNCSVAVLPAPRWFFRASAVRTNGAQSVPSNVVEWESVAEPPVMGGVPWVRLAPVLERSTNGGSSWTSFVGLPTWVPATNVAELFGPRGLVIERVTRVGGP